MELKINEHTALTEVPENISQTNVIKKNAPKTQVSYDDILSNMGMYVKNGKLHTYSKNQVQNQVDNEDQVKNVKINPATHSYIYNKYFKDEFKPEISKPRVPKNWMEYRKMIMQDILQRERIKKIKSKQILYHNAYTNVNVNVSGHVPDLNKLFKFSQR